MKYTVIIHLKKCVIKHRQIVNFIAFRSSPPFVPTEHNILE